MIDTIAILLISVAIICIMTPVLKGAFTNKALTPTGEYLITGGMLIIVLAGLFLAAYHRLEKDPYLKCAEIQERADGNYCLPYKEE